MKKFVCEKELLGSEEELLSCEEELLDCEEELLLLMRKNML